MVRYWCVAGAKRRRNDFLFANDVPITVRSTESNSAGSPAFTRDVPVFFASFWQKPPPAPPPPVVYISPAIERRMCYHELPSGHLKAEVPCAVHRHKDPRLLVHDLMFAAVP